MSWVIKYYYKDCLISVMAITADIKRAGWPNNNPPYQPENWDKWEVAPLVRGESLAGEKAKLLSGAVSSVISIITLYVGAKIQESRDRIRSRNMYRKNDSQENKKD